MAHWNNSYYDASTNAYPSSLEANRSNQYEQYYNNIPVLFVPPEQHNNYETNYSPGPSTFSNQSVVWANQIESEQINNSKRNKESNKFVEFQSQAPASSHHPEDSTNAGINNTGAVKKKNSYTNRRDYYYNRNNKYDNERYSPNDKRVVKNDRYNSYRNRHGYYDDRNYQHKDEHNYNRPKNTPVEQQNQRHISNTREQQQYRNSRFSNRKYKDRTEDLDRRVYSTPDNKYKDHKEDLDRRVYSTPDSSYRVERNFSRQNYPRQYKKNQEDNKLKSSSSSSMVGDTKTSENVSKKVVAKRNNVENFVTLREKLTEQARTGTVECLVCCERIRQENEIWSCQNCYHILHLSCIKKWATSSKIEGGGWRCPACQFVTTEIPSEYFCYCRKMKKPSYKFGELPHSCGEVCGRSSKRKNCSHHCTLLCHPGPCPECTIFVNRKCGCGVTTLTVQCSNTTIITCDNICNKLLNCGVHYCAKKCHVGECALCEEKIQQTCHCGKQVQEVTCTKDTVGNEIISCENTCGKLLYCNNHTCSKKCHEGACEECILSPEFVSSCHCGQTPLADEQKRTSCMDPIPCCDKVCNKKLKCGPPHNPHVCKSLCHADDCSPCDLFTLVRCRCGHMDREIPCKQLTGHPDDARCEKKCNKKRACGRHKCNKLCCIDLDHECTLPCNRLLSCGKHRCPATCHRGRCLPCLESSFEELYCECGANVIYPPVPCGTRRPTCSNSCTRQHICDHPVMHTCHSESECPPCTMLITKWCYGKHEVRKTIPCHQESFSCGRPCGKDLLCGHHKCIAMCHEGPCLIDGVAQTEKLCNQPCNIPRPGCGHPCANSCHDGPCLVTPCKQMVKVSCQCGHRTTMRSCTEQNRDYQRIMTSLLASKMKDVQLGNSVDIGDLVSNTGNKKEARLKTLDCNEECKVIERNRRLAIGLQIRNPDLSQKLTPRYSDFMKQWAKKDPRFCQRVHDKLTELVQLAKQSKQKSRSYSFESMNRDKRHFIHEYCEHFGCESAAYDQEPNRNVVATASRDKAWLPSFSLLEVIQRESGQRKVPGPMLRAPNNVRQTNTPPASTSQLTSMRLGNRETSSRIDTSTTLISSSASMATVHNNTIDYFDNSSN